MKRLSARRGVLGILLGCGLLLMPVIRAQGAPPAQAPLRVLRFLPEMPINRAQRPAPLTAAVLNMTETALNITPQLVLTAGVRLLSAETNAPFSLDAAQERKLAWEILAEAPGHYELRLVLTPEGGAAITVSLPMDFLEAKEIRKLPYIPEPQPVRSKLLVGAHHCPLWEADKPEMWAQLLKHPERTPALGFYAQENPEVSDWETKWASEHGIDFFIYCWYRASQGEAVKTRFSSAIHDGLFKSKFADKMKFTIMWENQSRGVAGVADERDLMENLLPYWIENYFKHPSYVKIDNKPLLFIYRPEFLVDDLGSVENVVSAFNKMREACKAAGFDGLYLLGEYRGLDPKHFDLMKSLGLDYTFAYCWYVPNNPTPEQAIETQMGYIKKTQELGILPQVVTVSQAWSGWADEGTIWKIPPEDFKSLLRQGKEFVATLPPDELGSKMLLLDNWNEWGEGHYLAPYREYGFGYVDAVREVLAENTEPHEDLIPEDIGMGPYDTAYKEYLARQEEGRKLVSKVVRKGEAVEPGLIGWWAFDEEADAAVAYDYAGHGLGGFLRDAKRAPGIDGNALFCKGGCVEVLNNARLNPATGLTITCWVKTDVAGQDNTWMVNRVFSGGTATGYRLGVLKGKPCFEVPQTDWSHHLTAAEPLPIGRWVHLAGTFDGQIMRIFVDGKEQGSMERPGPVNANAFKLCLGSYEIRHVSHFKGLLDEVKLYDRALDAAEIHAQFQQLVPKK